MALREWLKELAENERAVARLEHLLSHTLHNEETVFPSITEAGEVFAILWMAYTAGGPYFDEWVAHTASDVSFIGMVQAGRTDVDGAKDAFTFTARNVAKPTDLAVDLY